MPSIEVMTDLARTARDAIREQIPIRRFGRLRKGVRFIVTTERVTIFSIYYWSRAINDGRGEVRPRTKRALAWFRDPKKDPRIKADYPRQKKQVESLGTFLTAKRMAYLVRVGALIVRQVSGGTNPERYYELGLQAARKLVPAKVRKRIQTDVRKNLVRRNKRTVTIRL